MDQPVVKNNSKCNFCKTKKNNYLRYGPIYELGNITAHYYCVLLSNRLIQNGSDEEGILGFLLSDIENELQRTSHICCTYCKRGNATIKCAAKKCKNSFHLPCGLKDGSLHQFVQQFKSFCHKHRPVQNIPEKIIKEACKTKTICCICYEKVNVKDKQDTLWAPCCLRTWYHRLCVQKLAHSAGYFFRCAGCNNAKKFKTWMQKFGIFIPQQDASWELVPNAFEELLFRYSKCDANECKCPDGRQKNVENTIWEIILCESCGSQGMHKACGNLKFVDPEWECPGCQKITKNIISTAEIHSDEGSSKALRFTEVCQKKRHRSSENVENLENSALDKRKKIRLTREKDEEDNEIDVEILDDEPRKKDGVLTVAKEAMDVKTNREKDLQDVLTLLKPGPLSYKLAIIGQVLENSIMPLGKSVEKRDAMSASPAMEFRKLSFGKKDRAVDVKAVEENKEQAQKSDFIFGYRIKEKLTKVKEDEEERSCAATSFDEIAEASTNPLSLTSSKIIASISFSESRVNVVLSFDQAGCTVKTADPRKREATSKILKPLLVRISNASCRHNGTKPCSRKGASIIEQTLFRHEGTEFVYRHLPNVSLRKKVQLEIAKTKRLDSRNEEKKVETPINLSVYYNAIPLTESKANLKSTKATYSFLAPYCFLKIPPSISSTKTPNISDSFFDLNKRHLPEKFFNMSPMKSTALTSSVTKAPQPPDLLNCKICERHFAADRLSEHEEICQKSLRIKRKPSNAFQQRVKGTEVEQFIKIPTTTFKVQPEKTAKPPSNWRKTHEELINNIRAAKEVSAFLKKGGKLSDLPPPPPSDYSDYVPCPHCGRKFNSSVAERHIPKCINIIHNKPKPNMQKNAKLKQTSKLMQGASPSVRGRK